MSGSLAANTSSSGRQTGNGAEEDDEEDAGEGGRGASKGMFCERLCTNYQVSIIIFMTLFHVSSS